MEAELHRVFKCVRISALLSYWNLFIFRPKNNRAPLGTTERKETLPKKYITLLIFLYFYVFMALFYIYLFRLYTLNTTTRFYLYFVLKYIHFSCVFKSFISRYNVIFHHNMYPFNFHVSLLFPHAFL